MTNLPLVENQILSPTSTKKYDIETLSELILWQPGLPSALN